MSTKNFSKEFLTSIALYDYDDEFVEVKQRSIIDHNGDSLTLTWRVVFTTTASDSHYMTIYKAGLSNYPDILPYDFENAEIPCYEVVPRSRVVTVYEEV